MKNIEKIVVLDNGSQYTHLIVKSVRELNIYCELRNQLPTELDELLFIKGVILSGGPDNISDDYTNYLEIKDVICPILGICYGAQYIAKYYGADIMEIDREYGKTKIDISNEKDLLFKNIDSSCPLNVWMSHSNSIIENLSSSLIMEVSSVTENGNIASFKMKDRYIYGVLFHPEVSHTSNGERIINNFLEICKCKREWKSKNIVNKIIKNIKYKVKNDWVIMAISGGVDSTVAASLIHKAIGRRLLCLFIDNGLLRKGEFKEVLETYKQMNFNVQGIDFKKKFIQRLKNVVDPEEKRKVIGKTFIDVFCDYTKKMSTKLKYLGQGTIYSDVIESSHGSNHSRKIKSHHNVGGLPDKLSFELIEPLRYLFKDEVRSIGKTLKIPDKIRIRHPFPGPGLGIRIIGNITEEKINILQNADHIFITMLKENNLYKKIWQAGVILLNTKTVGVMGDERTYEYVVALRAVCSREGMTANIYPFNLCFLEEVSNKIINNVTGINRVVYDVSSKPPATIEWE